MRTNLLRQAGLYAILLFVLVACSKKDEPASKATLLVRKWKQTDLLVAQTGTPPVSVYNTLVENCSKDDIWEFKADGTFTVVEGATKCDPSDPDLISTGTWQLIENETKLVVDDVSEPAQTLTINELTASTLRATGTEVVNGLPLTVVGVFTAQ